MATENIIMAMVKAGGNRQVGPCKVIIVKDNFDAINHNGLPRLFYPCT